MNQDVSKILSDIEFLMKVVWPTAKQRKDKGRHWIKAHVGQAMSNCTVYDLKVLRYLLAFKAKDGDCPIVEHHYNHKIRRKEVMPHHAVWRAIRLGLIDKAQGRCKHCGEERSDLTIDHMIPIFDGGTSDTANLQVLCTECHQKKTQAEDWKHLSRFRKHKLRQNVALARKYYEDFLATQKRGRV